MIGAHSTGPASGMRQFTVFTWLLWTLIPALAVGALDSVTDYAAKSAGNRNPASVMAGITAAALMTLLLVPTVTTLQWLILRRGWPRLLWPAWLLVVIVSVASVMAVPFVMMKTSSPLYGMVLPILTIALAAAAVLSVASPQPLRRSAFAVIFLFFLSGGALMCGINTPPMGGLLLEASYFNPFTAHPSILALARFHIFHFIFGHRELFSLAGGAAVSGFGLWLVSRWASQNEGAVPAVRHGSM